MCSEMGFYGRAADERYEGEGANLRCLRQRRQWCLLLWPPVKRRTSVCPGYTQAASCVYREGIAFDRLFTVHSILRSTCVVMFVRPMTNHVKHKACTGAALAVNCSSLRRDLRSISRAFAAALPLGWNLHHVLFCTVHAHRVARPYGRANALLWW